MAVSANGEWQDVVVDFSAFGARGMLKTLQLELFTDTLKGAVGDTLDVASVSFFADADAAYASLGMENPNRVTEAPSDPQGDPNAGEQTGGAGEEKSGCGSAVNGAVAGLLPMLAALPVIKGRRRRRASDAV